MWAGYENFQMEPISSLTSENMLMPYTLASQTNTRILKPDPWPSCKESVHGSEPSLSGPTGGRSGPSAHLITIVNVM